MLADHRKFIPPAHKAPRLHKDALLMSFENQWSIRQAYKEIIGLNDIDHLSINKEFIQNIMMEMKYF